MNFQEMGLFFILILVVILNITPIKAEASASSIFNTAIHQTANVFESINCWIKDLVGNSCEVQKETIVIEQTKEENQRQSNTQNTETFTIDRQEDRDTQIIYKEVPVQTNSTNPNSYTKQETLSLLARLKNEILNIIPSETTTIVERTSANTASVDYDRIYNVINKNIENVYEALGDRTEGEDSTTNFNGSS